jgi:formate dehydrogenase subunit gamma
VPDGPGAKPNRVHRFSRGERWVHRTTAIVMVICIGTAACLYLGPLAQLVGRRHLVATVHQWSGLLLLGPVGLGSLLSAAVRADLRILNRFTHEDQAWLRHAFRRRRSVNRHAGKFNAGQKVYAAWLVGAVLAMLLSGLLLWFKFALPSIPRGGVIFVHDIFALAIVIVIVGHIRKAAQDPEARRGMRTGSVRRSWAERHHPLWAEELDNAAMKPGAPTDQ